MNLNTRPHSPCGCEKSEPCGCNKFTPKVVNNGCCDKKEEDCGCIDDYDCYGDECGCINTIGSDCWIWEGETYPWLSIYPSVSGTKIIENIIDFLKNYDNQTFIKSIGKGIDIYKGFDGEFHQIRTIQSSDSVQVEELSGGGLTLEIDESYKTKLNTEYFKGKSTLTLSKYPTHIIGITYCGAELPLDAWSQNGNKISLNLSKYGLSVANSDNISVKYMYN